MGRGGVIQEATEAEARGQYFLEDEVVPEFHCIPRRKCLSLEVCLARHRDAMALSNKLSLCWKCPQGKRNREEFVAAQLEE